MNTQTKVKQTLLTLRDTRYGTVTLHRIGEPTKYLAEFQDKDLAELIVRAVNSHEALLEATKRAVKLLDNPAYIGELRVKNKLEEAIANAEGR